jgi:hypothetical protein
MRDGKGNKVKPTKEQSKSFTQYRLDSLLKQFEEQSKIFVRMTEVGGGIENYGMMETVRSLHFLCMDIAVHRDALRSLEVEI